jgi:xanthine dehydrogenase molybdenum-binding subunit
VYYTKDEHFGAFVLRLGSRFRGRIGIKKDGTVTAVAGEWLVDTGAFSDMAQSQIAVGCGEAQLVLQCENWHLTTRLICTNRSASGVIRGFGGQELEAAIAPVLSDVMAKADLDPVAFFKKNFVKPGGEFVWREGRNWTCRGKDYSEAMEKGARAFGWQDKWKGWFQPTAAEGPKRIGIGVGIHGNADVGEDDSEAYIRLNADGTATIHASVSESGMGQRSSLCKMAAEVLQLPLERVNMTPPDTMVNPFDFGLVGSRGTYAVGSAIISAAEDALQKLYQTSAPKLDAAPDELKTMDGKIFVKGDPKRAISWSRAIGIMHTVTGFGEYEADYSVPNFLILFVEVEVDTETGLVKINRVVTATDVGQVIDPPSLAGQLYGALGSAGLDTAVFEETVIDRNSGHMLNMNMSDYKWRTFADLPEFENVILETPFPTHRFKAIGVGEVATAPAPGAVLMAVSNAVGKPLHHYPLTPDRVLGALGKVKR